MSEIHNGKRELQLERIVFFSDAVFAIAITLLVIEIKIPHLEANATNEEMLQGFLLNIPKYIGFFISFLIIGAYWTGHHRLYGFIKDFNQGLLWRNLLFLMFVAFMPFTTGFLSETFFGFVPLVVYGLTSALAGLMQLWQWRYAVKSGFVAEGVDGVFANMISWRILAVPIASLLAIFIGWILTPKMAGIAFMSIPISQTIISRAFANKTQEPSDD
jgi:uncharacterized membrane protein